MAHKRATKQFSYSISDSQTLIQLWRTFQWLQTIPVPFFSIHISESRLNQSDSHSLEKTNKQTNLFLLPLPWVDRVPLWFWPILLWLRFRLFSKKTFLCATQNCLPLLELESLVLVSDDPPAQRFPGVVKGGGSGVRGRWWWWWGEGESVMRGEEVIVSKSHLTLSQSIRWAGVMMVVGGEKMMRGGK